MDCEIQQNTKYYRFVINVFKSATSLAKFDDTSERDIEAHLEKLEKFHNSLSSKILFIFVGIGEEIIKQSQILSTEKTIEEILINVQTNKKLPVGTDLIRLKETFGNIDSWEIDSSYESIYFIRSLINEYDTLRDMINISSKYINRTLEDNNLFINLDSAYYYTDSFSYIDIEIENIEYSIIRYYEHNTRSFNIDKLKTILHSYLNIPHYVIDSLPEDIINDFNIKKIFEVVDLKKYLKKYLKFKSLSKKLINKESLLELKLLPFIEAYLTITNYISDPSIIHTNELIEDSHFLDELIINNTDSNTIHILSFRNITTMSYITNDTSYKNLFSLHLKSLENLKDKSPIYTDTITDFTFDDTAYFNQNLKIKEYFSRFDFKCSGASTGASAVAITVNYKTLMFNIKTQFNIQKYSDLKRLFDSIKLSYNVPLMKFKDKSIESLMLKIYKPITHIYSDKYKPIVDSYTLKNWINFNKIVVNNFKVVGKKAHVNGLSIKLKIADINDDTENQLTGIIKDILHSGEQVYNIESDGVIYQKINNTKLIDPPVNIKVGTPVTFYKRLPIYAHLDIYKSGDVIISFDLEKINTTDIKIKRIIENSLETINKFFETQINTIPHTNYSAKQVKISFLKSKYIPIPNFTHTIKYNLITYTSLDSAFIHKTLEIFSGFILLDITNEDTKYLTLLFRLNNNNNKEYIHHYIDHLIKKNIPRDTIIHTIKNKFPLSNKEIVSIYSHLKYSGSIKLKHTLDSFPKISIDYKNTSNISDKLSTNVLIENINSYNTRKYIFKFLNFLEQIKDYIYTRNNSLPFANTNPIFKELYIKYTASDIVVDVDIPITINEETDSVYESGADSDSDSDSLHESDFSDDESLSELSEMELANIEIKPKKSDAPRPKIIRDTIPIKSKPGNTILYNLIYTDPLIFETKGYARRCQAGRQPIVLTDVYKNKIDMVTSTHQGNYTKLYGKIDKDLNDCIPPLGNTDEKCSAIKIGSSDDNKNWYICPKIYNIDNNAPTKLLNWSDLKYFNPEYNKDEPESITNKILYDYLPSQPIGIGASSAQWYIDSASKKHIKEFRPIYFDVNGVKYGFKKIATSRVKYGPTQEKYNPDNIDDPTIIYTLLGNEKYLYPGMRHDIVPNETCCYTRPNKGLKEETPSGKNNEDYLVGSDKKLALGQAGLLTQKLYDYLEDLGPHNTGKIKAKDVKQGKYYRKGTSDNENSNENFLIAMDAIYGGSTAPRPLNKIKKDLIYKLSLDNSFNSYNNRFLSKIFATDNIITPYQNFLEYILSDELKKYEFFYEYYNTINTTCTIILEKTNSDYNIILPYFSGTICKRISDNYYKDVAVLLKNNNTYDRVLLKMDGLMKYTTTGPRGKEKDWVPRPERELFTIARGSHDSVTHHLVCQRLTKMYREIQKILEKTTKHPSVYHDTKYKKSFSLKELFKSYEEDTQEKLPKLEFLVKDSYELLIGVKTENKLFIPLYPEKQPLELKPTQLKLFVNDVKNIKDIVIRESYSAMDEKTVSDHIRLYSNLKKHSKEEIDISVSELFVSNGGKIEGFNTNVGSYTKCKPESLVDVSTELKKIGQSKNNYVDIDAALIKPKVEYPKPLNNESLTRLINIYITANKDISITKVYINNNEHPHIDLLEINGIFIHIQPISNEYLKTIFSTYTELDKRENAINLNRITDPPIIEDIEEYSDKLNEMLVNTEYKFPIFIYKYKIDDSDNESVPDGSGTAKNLSGEEIDEKKEHVTINKVCFITKNDTDDAPLEIKFKEGFDIHDTISTADGDFRLKQYTKNLHNEGITNLINTLKSNKKFINKYTYNNKLIEYIQFRFNRLLSSIEYRDTYECIVSILNNTLISSKLKSLLLLPIIHITFKKYFTSKKVVDNKYPAINNNILDNTNSRQPLIFTRENDANYEEYESGGSRTDSASGTTTYKGITEEMYLWNSIRYMTNKYKTMDDIKNCPTISSINLNSDELVDLTIDTVGSKVGEKIKDQLLESDKSILTTARETYNKLLNIHNGPINKINILQEEDGFGKTSKLNIIRNQITEDLVQNIYIRASILHDYVHTIEIENYQSNSVSELIMNKRDIVNTDTFIEELYKPESSKFLYYNDIDNFDSIKFTHRLISNRRLMSWKSTEYNMTEDYKTCTSKIDKSNLTQLKHSDYNELVSHIKSHSIKSTPKAKKSKPTPKAKKSKPAPKAKKSKPAPKAPRKRSPCDQLKKKSVPKCSDKAECEWIKPKGCFLKTDT